MLLTQGSLYLRAKLSQTRLKGVLKTNERIAICSPFVVSINAFQSDVIWL